MFTLAFESVRCLKATLKKTGIYVVKICQFADEEICCGFHANRRLGLDIKGQVVIISLTGRPDGIARLRWLQAVAVPCSTIFS